MRALRYAFEEALTSLWRGRGSGLLSTVTIALALFVLGGFLDVTANLERLGARVEQCRRAVGLPQGRHHARRAPGGGRRAGAERLWSRRANTSPSPTRSRASSRRSAISPRPSTASAGTRCRRRSRCVCGRAPAQRRRRQPAPRLRQMAGVADVRYDRQWLTRVLAAIDVIRGVGLALGLGAGGRRGADRRQRGAAGAICAARRAGHHEPGRRAAGLCPRPVRHGRGPAGRRGRADRAGGARGGVFRVARPLSRAAGVGDERVVDPLSPAWLCVALVVGGMAVGCLGGLVAAWNR